MKIISLALAVLSSAMAATVTLTMDEVAIQPINGLTVSKGGESFTFSNPLGTLSYNSSGPGALTFVQDPSIQGTPTPFGIAFAVPVYSIRFGLAENIFAPVMGIAKVDLFFNNVLPFATLTINSSLVDPVAEGQFNFSSGPISNILITPNVGPPALAFDNLTVNTTPEPSTFAMCAGAAALAAVRIFRRRRICIVGCVSPHARC